MLFAIDDKLPRWCRKRLEVNLICWKQTYSPQFLSEALPPLQKHTVNTAFSAALPSLSGHVWIWQVYCCALFKTPWMYFPTLIFHNGYMWAFFIQFLHQTNWSCVPQKAFKALNDTFTVLLSSQILLVAECFLLKSLIYTLVKHVKQRHANKMLPSI